MLAPNPPVIVSRAHQKLLVPATSRVKALWPDARTLTHNGIDYAVIPHAPSEHMQLRSIGHEVPAPITCYYDWEQGEPFDTQRITAALATSNGRAYILSDMGVGKTAAVLWAWRYLSRAGAAGKLLVVAPLSTLEFTWAREAMIRVPGVKVAVLHGSAADRRKLLNDRTVQIYIVNHHGVKVIAKELEQRLDIDTLVLDELAVYRNRTQRSLYMRTFAQRFKWVWGMSGRPMPNAPTDVWAQAKILTPGSVPKHFLHAQSLLMVKVGLYKWVPKPDAAEKALSWLQPNVRFTLDDVMELPPAIYRTIDVKMSDEQAKGYKKLSADFALMVKEKIITAANAGVAMNKLLQVGSGYVYTVNPEYVTLNSDPRKDMLLELINAAPQKVIVFAPWRHLIDNLTILLNDNDIEHAVIHGGIKHRERDEIFSDFQLTGKYRVLLCHPGCVHHGLTLTSASTIIWYSPVASLEIYEQANARIRRPTQKHKQQYLHLQASAVEKRVYSLLRSKQKVQDEFLAMVKGDLNGAGGAIGS